MSNLEAVELLSSIVDGSDELHELRTNWDVQKRYTLNGRMEREYELQQEIQRAINDSRDLLCEIRTAAK